MKFCCWCSLTHLSAQHQQWRKMEPVRTDTGGRRNESSIGVTEVGNKEILRRARNE